jgi:hypothetical protein
LFRFEEVAWRTWEAEELGLRDPGFGRERRVAEEGAGLDEFCVVEAVVSWSRRREGDERVAADGGASLVELGAGP